MGYILSHFTFVLSKDLYKYPASLLTCTEHSDLCFLFKRKDLNYMEFMEHTLKVKWNYLACWSCGVDTGDTLTQLIGDQRGQIGRSE